MKKILQVTKVITVNLLILFVLLETGSAGFYFYRTREFFYTRSKERVAATRAQFETGSQANGPDSGLVYQLHPYFGFVSKDGGGYNDLPYQRADKKQFLIGIFGGSVANQYYVYERRQGNLIKALQRLPQFQNREIVILRFCHPAYKQPQQLLVLNYFLSIGQELDMAINIDGFNEISLAYVNNKNGIDFSMPADFLMTPLVDLANKDFSPGQIELALKVLQIKNQLRNSLDGLNRCKLAICYSLKWAQSKYLFAQYQASSVAFTSAREAGPKSSLVRFNRIDKPLSDSEILDRAADEWAKSSRTMNDILTATGIEYFQFIQPNQYYSPNRHFDEEEKKVAITDNSPFSLPISIGYSKLLARMTGLKDSGVKVFSAVGIFDETKGIVYIDNCCHYNDKGLGILSDYVARSIVQETNGRTNSGAEKNAR